jgi:signal transduction histidine kinase
MIFELPTAAIIFWGPEQIQLYNDGYAVIMGPRHPRHLGSRFRDCWPEAFDAIDPWMQRVLKQGETVEVVKTLVPLTRHGFIEEAYFTFSFSPLRDDDGKIAGVLQLVTEITEAVLGERRTALLHELSNQIGQARSAGDAARLAVDALSHAGADLPFALLYSVSDKGGAAMKLAGAVGMAEGPGPFPGSLEPSGGASLPEVGQALLERRKVLIEDLAGRFGALSLVDGAEAPRTGFAVPILTADQQSVAGVLIGGLSPRLALDPAYRAFLRLLAAQLASLFAEARAYDDERKKTVALAELEAANRELDAFSYSVAHDLRAPLRSIDGFSEALQEDCGPQLGEAGQRHLRMIRDSAQHMGRLIDDLLSLARVSRNELRRQRVDLTALAQEIARRLSQGQDGRQVELKIQPGMVCDGDPTLLGMVLENLLGNAWKFTAKRERASIEFGSHGAAPLSYYVRDNGAGFDMAYASKLFGLFQRLHSPRDFEGTGVGLATVRRIVERHGGRAWAEAAVDKGTTVYFTLEGTERA